MDISKRVTIGLKKSITLLHENIEKHFTKVVEEKSNKGKFSLIDFIDELIFKVNIPTLLGEEAMGNWKEIKETLSGIEKNGLLFTFFFFFF